jgi:hypothetical protein
LEVVCESKLESNKSAFLSTEMCALRNIEVDISVNLDCISFIQNMFKVIGNASIYYSSILKTKGAD